MKPHSQENTIQIAKPHGWEGGLAPAQAWLLSFLNLRESFFLKLSGGKPTFLTLRHSKMIMHTDLANSLKHDWTATNLPTKYDRERSSSLALCGVESE